MSLIKNNEEGICRKKKNNVIYFLKLCFLFSMQTKMAASGYMDRKLLKPEEWI